MSSLTVIGAPTSAGAYAPGQEEGPAALREHGLVERLRDAGLAVSDAGDVEPFRWRPDLDAPRAANAAAVIDRARQVADRVAAAADERVLVLGGDCTVGVGTLAAFAARGPGLVYFDRHADLNVPFSTVDGALDWMGVAHMLGVDGTVPALAGLAGEAPMLSDGALVYLGLGPVTTFEEEVIAARDLPSVELEQTIAEPAAAAREALATLGERETIVVHFDVDVLDFLDAPLAENTDRRAGLPLQGVGEALATLLADPRVRALTVTEFNPHHGAPDGTTTRRLVDVLVAALAQTLR